MFTYPAGPDLTTAQARELDDALFGSKPMGYLHARIDNLLRPRHDTPTEQGEPDRIREGFEAILGPIPELLDIDDSAHELQVAVDAFAVRHHAAEALVRLYHALAVAPQFDPVCIWRTLVDGPTRTIDLVRQTRKHLDTQAARDSFWRLLLPPQVAQTQPKPALQAVQTAAAWLLRCTELLVSGELDINAAHNKVKHGLAVRPRDDLRSMFSLVGPSDDDTLPLSATTGSSAIDIFTRTTLQFLSRPPHGGARTANLELTTLQLVPERLLAEAWMISSVFGVMFHHAALAHLTRHPASEDDPKTWPLRKRPTLADAPRLPLGPRPDQMLDERVLGLRTPITTRTDGTAGRPTALVFENDVVVTLQVDVSNARTVTIVDD